MTTDTISRPSYNEDFHAWAFDQAQRLREQATLRANEPIDWALLADEVEDMGRRDLRSAASYVKLVLGHFLKLEFVRDSEPMRHWIKEVTAFRKNLRRELTASIEVRLRDDLAELFEIARAETVADLWRDPEFDARAPETCPYSWEQITGDWWPERARE